MPAPASPCNRDRRFSKSLANHAGEALDGVGRQGKRYRGLPARDRLLSRHGKSNSRSSMFVEVPLPCSS